MTTRRQVLQGVMTLGAVAASQGAARPAGALPPSSAVLPTVSMEAVLKAAQWDPSKVGTGLTPGAKASVLLVEAALRDKGHLAAGYVDGHFGTATVTAYTAWQRSLGYSGLGANGLPGTASLTALGQGRFTLGQVVSIGSKQAYQRQVLSTRTLAMLRAAQARWGGGTFLVTQGSYAPGQDSTSAGSHDGGGAVDLDAEQLTAEQRTAALVALREVGFAAWLRNPTQDSWPWHIHGIAISDTDLAPLARRQVGDYYEGRNGLASARPDDGPAVPKVTYEEFLRR